MEAVCPDRRLLAQASCFCKPKKDNTEKAMQIFKITPREYFS